MNYQIQLNVQLLDVGRVVKSGANKVTELLQFARDLRKTHSDVFIEEEVADVLGRARVELSIKEVFKTDVLRDAKIVPLWENSPIAFSIGAGPTLSRALRDQDPKYLSAIIQLSFLSRFYDAPNLSVMLSRCMNKRSNQLVGANVIQGVLEACTSEASITIWDGFVRATEQRLQQTVMDHNPNLPGLDTIFKKRGMSATAVLASLDYFFLVQNLPEDRKIIARISHGIVAMIVWAHYILGLTVHVEDLHSQIIIFGEPDEAPSMIIQENTSSSVSEEEVLLLDADGQIVLRCDHDTEDSFLSIDDHEKHALLDWGTEVMRRHFNASILIKDEDPVYQDTAALIISIALKSSAALKYHVLGKPEDADQQFRDLNVEAWRVFDSARMLFQSLNIKKESPKTYVKFFEDKDNVATDPDLPASIRRVCEKIRPLLSPARVASFIRKTQDLILHLAYAILTFAHAHDITRCASLPISLDYACAPLPRSLSALVVRDVLDGLASVTLDRDEFYNSAKTHMFGSLIVQEPKQCFIHSLSGWSLVLGGGYNINPSETRPSMFRIQQGVPTHTTTGERKRFVCDGPSWNQDPGTWRVVDTGKSYIPRQLATVMQKREFCSSIENRFNVTLQLDVEYEGIGESTFSLVYLFFHYNSWRCFRTKPCDCPEKRMDEAPLGFGAATVTGDPWTIGGKMESSIIEQRICVYLAREHRALCFKSRGIAEDCEIVTKTKDCCESCALTAASSLPGKVMLIV